MSRYYREFAGHSSPLTLLFGRCDGSEPGRANFPSRFGRGTKPKLQVFCINLSCMVRDVTFNVPDRPLGHNDVIFTVRQSGRILGTLKVSKGALVWRPGRGKQSYKLAWSQFDTVVKEKGSKAFQS
jgi:hypothetical protein